jgi:hypothetical protein
MMQRLVVLSLAWLLAVIAACAPASTIPSTSASLQDLADFGQFERQFAHDMGRPRLILLVSPT